MAIDPAALRERSNMTLPYIPAGFGSNFLFQPQIQQAQSAGFGQGFQMPALPSQSSGLGMPMIRDSAMQQVTRPFGMPNFGMQQINPQFLTGISQVEGGRIPPEIAFGNTPVNLKKTLNPLPPGAGGGASQTSEDGSGVDLQSLATIAPLVDKFSESSGLTDTVKDWFSGGGGEYAALEGMPYDAAGMEAATSGVDLTASAGVPEATMPSVDVAEGLGAISSVAGPTLGSAYGLGTLGAGVGSAQTAAGLGAGYSSAASPSVASMFATPGASTAAGGAGASTAAGGGAAGWGAYAGPVAAAVAMVATAADRASQGMGSYKTKTGEGFGSAVGDNGRTLVTDSRDLGIALGGSGPSEGRMYFKGDDGQFRWLPQEDMGIIEGLGTGRYGANPDGTIITLDDNQNEVGNVNDYFQKYGANYADWNDWLSSVISLRENVYKG